jgi:hypothetical protein
MKAHRTATLLAIGLLSLTVAVAQDSGPAPQQAVVLSSAILDRIPAAYRDEAKRLVTVSDENQQKWLKLSDDDLTLAIIRQLAETSEGSAFLLAQLERESSGKTRSAIIGSLGKYWASHPESQKILEQRVSSDADATVSLQAFEMLRSMRMEDLYKLLHDRINSATKSHDFDTRDKLAAVDESWLLLSNKIVLPGFLRLPPPAFSLKPSEQAIRVLAFGDFGTGSEAQKQLAAAMLQYHKKTPFDFGLTLGDNFYPRGVNGLDDPQWKSKWEDMYSPLGIKFYATLGNHDWAQPDSPAAEVVYSMKSTSWRMPAPYYTFTAGPVQFFAFDTMEITDAELSWLDRELSKSQAPWRVVYGHHHIFSATRGDNKELVERLLPVLEKHSVDVYLNGHDHNLQELKSEGGVHFFVSGGGGANLYPLNDYDRSVFKSKVNGFTVLEADAAHLKISFVGTDGKELYEQELKKGPSAQLGNRNDTLFDCEKVPVEEAPRTDGAEHKTDSQSFRATPFHMPACGAEHMAVSWDNGF